MIKRQLSQEERAAVERWEAAGGCASRMPEGSAIKREEAVIRRSRIPGGFNQPSARARYAHVAIRETDEEQ